MKTKYFTIVLLSVVQLMFGVQSRKSIKNGDWNSASTWSPSGVPTSAEKIFIMHSVTLNTNFLPLDTIFVHGVLNIDRNTTLNLTVGMLVLVNDNTHDGRIGTLGKNSKIIGNFIFQKWINRCDGFSNYGFPFDVKTSDVNWYFCNRCMPDWSNIYYYDERVPGTYENGYHDSIGDNYSRGRGFFYWYSNYSGGLNFSRKISVKGSIDFLQEFDFGVTYTQSSGVVHDGYNLVSNPFPGTIDWMSGGWKKNKVQGVIYVWNSCTESYSSFSSGVGVNGGSRYIPSMQGFWVQTTGTNPQLKVGIDVLTDQSIGMMKSSGENIEKVLRLTLNNDEIAIRLLKGSTDSLDLDTDGLKFLSDNSTIMSHMVDDTLNYSINSIPDTTRLVQLKTKGGGMIKITGADTFNDEYDIYFVDNTNSGPYTKITEGFGYNFSTSGTDFEDLYSVLFVKKIKHVTTTGIVNYINELTRIRYDRENIYISVPEDFSRNVSITMCDLLGRELFSGTYSGQEIQLKKISEPVVLNVQNQYGRMVKKVF